MVNRKKPEKKDIDVRYNLSEYWNLLRKYKGMVFWMMFILVVIEIFQVVPKFLFKAIVDNGTLFAGGDMGVSELSFILLVIAGIYIGANILQITFFWFRSLVLSNLETNIMKDLKNRYFNHIIGLDHKFHTTHKTGSLISRLGRGSNGVERMTDSLVFNLIPLIVQLIVVGFSIAYFSLASAITVATVAVSFIFYSYFIQRAQNPSRLAANRAEDIEKAMVGDIFTNINSVKYFGKEKLIGKRFDIKTRDTVKRMLENWRYFRIMMVGQISIIALGTLALLYFPLMKFLTGEITLGTIVFIYTVYGNLMGPMWGFVHGMQGFYRSMTDFQDLFQYGKIDKEIRDKSDAKNMEIQKGEIEFKDISFSYAKRKIFNKFNLKVPSNKKYALVGHSGCGKSTLVNLLYRLYDVESGAILIDGKDIRDFKQESVRSEMAIVPQEAVLFDDTIWNNIRFSNPSASKDEIWKAIKFAQLDRIIAEMPNKENTIVGERGVKLSGGEKQRVSIARALLANKKILVLDEATSALDSETEHEIQKDLKRLMEGRTSIIIAHRLSTIMHADKIIVMKKGKIEQVGTHQQLIGIRGEYRKLWDLQKGGYIK